MKYVVMQGHQGVIRSITVVVTSEGGIPLTEICTMYDGIVLGLDAFNPPCNTYQRSFRQAEGMTPNQPHTVSLVVRDLAGNTDAAEETWID